MIVVNKTTYPVVPVAYDTPYHYATTLLRRIIRNDVPAVNCSAYFLMTHNGTPWWQYGVIDAQCAGGAEKG